MATAETTLATALSPAEAPALKRVDAITIPPTPTADRPAAEIRFGESILRLSVAHDLAAVETLWRNFERTADLTGFQAFDWLATWQATVGAPAGVIPAIVVGRLAGTAEPLFILPLAVERRAGLRRLVFLGRDLGDYNAPLLAPHFAALCGDGFPALWQSAQALLGADPRHRHDLVMLDKMPESVGGQVNPFLSLGPSLNPSGAYRATLADDWETFYNSRRTSSSRRRDRNKRRRLADQGEIALVSAADAAEARTILATLIAQKRHSFARMGVPDIFDRPGYVDFFQALAALPPERRLAHLSRLEVGAAAAATNLGLEFRGVYYHVLTSYDDGPLSRFGPGAIHLHDLLRRAIDNGCTCFDFTIGDEPYKRDWSDVTLRLFDLVEGVSLRGRALAATLDAKRRLKRAVKQSPWLWPLAQRLRMRLAGRTQPPAPTEDGAAR